MDKRPDVPAKPDEKPETKVTPPSTNGAKVAKVTSWPVGFSTASHMS
jgi:hypothetical protein